MTDANEQQRRYREFLDLLPLTIELAGLPRSEPGRYYSEEQLESRLITASLVTAEPAPRSPPAALTPSGPPIPEHESPRHQE